MVQANVRLMIDAEHSYFQPAIDHAVLELQRVFNAHRPTVFNTIQCYTKAWCRTLAALASSLFKYTILSGSISPASKLFMMPGLWPEARDDCHWRCCSVQTVGSSFGGQGRC